MSLKLTDFAPARVIDPNEELRALIAELRLAISLVNSDADYSEITTAIAALPAPVVNIDPVDLSDVIAAIEAIPQPQSDVQALVDCLIEALPKPDEMVITTLKEVTKALEKLEFRIKGTQFQASGGGPSNEAVVTAINNLGTATAVPTSSYQINDMDTAVVSAQYFGYESAGGAWYIKRLNETAGTVRYVAGASNYEIAWTNRATQTYGTFGSVF